LLRSYGSTLPLLRRSRMDFLIWATHRRNDAEAALPALVSLPALSRNRCSEMNVAVVDAAAHGYSVGYCPRPDMPAMRSP